MLSDILRNAVRGTWDIRSSERGTPPLQLAFFAGLIDPLFYIANGLEILVELMLVTSTDLSAKVLGLRP
jgi:hypothetical protein